MATYKIKTKRYIRKYTAAEKLPVSAALIDAQRVVDELCKIPWEQAAATTAVITAHDESELDANVSNRDRFDAALFCADHANGAHRAYANAACYKIPFPTGTAGKKITSLKVRVTSDAYNAAGARIALVTNSTGVIPTSCAECRGEGAGGIHAAGVAPQTIQTVGGQRYGYPTIADCIFNVSPGEGEYALPTGGLTLGSYLYVFVLMENYNSVRGNWLEGSSCIVNQIEIVTDSAITGWTDGSLIDLTQNKQTTLHLINLSTGEDDQQVSLTGTVSSMVQREIAFSDGNQSGLAVICGDFDEYSISGIPGLVVYDFLHRQIATVTVDSSHPIPESVMTGFRSKGVKLMVDCCSESSVSVMFDYEPVSGYLSIDLSVSNGGIVAAFYNSASTDFGRTKRQVEHWYGQAGYEVGLFYNDRIEFRFLNDDGSRAIPVVRGFSGSITDISGSATGRGYCLVSGNNKIDGNEDPVKLLSCAGEVMPFKIGIKPDTFDDFKVREVAFGAVDNMSVARYLGYSRAEPKVSETVEGYRLHYTNDDWPLVNPSQDAEGQNKLAWLVNGGVGFSGFGLLVTGQFKSLGGINANGAAFVFVRSNGSLNGATAKFQYVVIPLDIGRVRNACVFAHGSDGIECSTHYSQNDKKWYLSHLLVEYAD